MACSTVCFDYGVKDRDIDVRVVFKEHYKVLAALPSHRNIVRYLAQFEERQFDHIAKYMPTGLDVSPIGYPKYYHSRRNAGD